MSSPVVARTRAELEAAREAMTGRVAVVMTMGALHEGHVTLMHRAREVADSVLVTVFVNPLQFGVGEDFDRYPRTWDADLAACAGAGVDVVFAPTTDVIYPSGDALVRVHAGRIGERLEGEHRPGHLDGMLTVVLKLLHLTRPDLALYGEKDAQQLALIRQMVKDLDVDVDIVGVPTVREPDGLAMSSRNRYLSVDERQTALALSTALRAGAAAGAEGPEVVLAAAHAVLDAAPGLTLDYLALVDDETWQEPTGPTPNGRLLVAARVGTTRLIDNVSVDLGTAPAG